mgnify:CR=1 FL=1
MKEILERIQQQKDVLTKTKDVVLVSSNNLHGLEFIIYEKPQEKGKVKFMFYSHDGGSKVAIVFVSTEGIVLKSFFEDFTNPFAAPSMEAFETSLNYIHSA